MNYTGVRQKNGIDTISSVPTAAERTGDFSGIAQTIYNPATNSPFPGNIIPSSQINPTSSGAAVVLPVAQRQRPQE